MFRQAVRILRESVVLSYRLWQDSCSAEFVCALSHSEIVKRREVRERIKFRVWLRGGTDGSFDVKWVYFVRVVSAASA